LRAPKQNKVCLSNKLNVLCSDSIFDTITWNEFFILVGVTGTETPIVSTTTSQSSTEAMNTGEEKKPLLVFPTH
jgi:hypothetical protein